MQKSNGYAMLVAAATWGLASNAEADVRVPVAASQDAAKCPQCGSLRRTAPSPYVLHVPWFGRTLTLPTPDVSRRSGPVNRFHRVRGK